MWIIPSVVIVVGALAEWLHARRVNRVSGLVFGAGGRPRAWSRTVPVVRCAALGALAWGLLILASLDGGGSVKPSGRDPMRRLILCLDVSPSMTLADAGAEGTQSRAGRAADILRSVLGRLDTSKTKVSVVVFYAGAKPAVIDAVDMGIVLNILNDLPLEYAFEPGPTNMYDGVREAFAIAKNWPAGSAAFLMVSDGDTLPASGLPSKPVSIADVLIVGVGDAHRGEPIAGRTSRQDGASLDRLALRLGGDYHDGNVKGIPYAVLNSLSLRAPRVASDSTRRDAALACVGVGASVVAGLSPALALWGAPRRPRPKERLDAHNASRGGRSGFRASAGAIA